MQDRDAVRHSRASAAAPGVLDLAVIGGGAGGFFTALQFAAMAPAKAVAIFEKGGQFLHKVRLSGGGRCNVTHACFNPRELAKNYPRGSRELLAAFQRWQPADTAEWFDRCGLPLKTEADGRMFPHTDSSQSVIDCFMERARASHIALLQQHALIGIEPLPHGGFTLEFAGLTKRVEARTVCVATGSLKDSPLLEALVKLQQPIEPLVPSLFAFNVNDPRLSGLAGVAHPKVGIRRDGSHPAQHGPLLITHRGVSGPAVLRLSAWEARALAATNHHFPFLIDWLPDMKMEAVKASFAANRQSHGAKLVRNSHILPIPRRLWVSLAAACGIEATVAWAQLSKTAALCLGEMLKASRFEATGKTTNKDEFVTCGGIARPSIDFLTMQSRLTPGLYFVGECIDIDGLTGGFNFQAAWTTAHIAATAIAAS
jgi:predicted Rossmann fold flavoprotein